MLGEAVFPDAKLDEFKETDVDQRLQSRQSVILVLMQLLTEVCTVGDTGYVITTTDRTDMAEIFRLVLVSV